MAKIFVSFEAASSDELTELILSYALHNKKPPSWVGAPLDAEALQAEAEARERIDAEDEAGVKSNGEDYLPQRDLPMPVYEFQTPSQSSGSSSPEPEPPAKRVRAPRAPRVSGAPPAPPPAPPPPPAPDPGAWPRSGDSGSRLPPLDALKATVTSAVRLAQKGEASRAILDLLPAFKDTTGLTFVMNAEDKHRAALYELVQAAGLPIV